MKSRRRREWFRRSSAMFMALALIISGLSLPEGLFSITAKAAQEKDVESFCKNLHRKTTDSKGKPIANMPKRNAWNLENCLKGRFSD